MADLKRITLYRIKGGSDFHEFLKGSLETYDRVEDADSGVDGYIKFERAGGGEKTDDAIPWLVFLNSGFEEKKYRFSARNSFPRAIMALKITDGNSSTFYAATFGQHGDSFLEKSLIAYDFGIKVAMNICDIDKLRRVQTSVHESISRQTERQASTGANLNVFGINIESEFLRTISGHVKAEFAPLIESFRGKDSIALKLPRDADFAWEEMVAVCRRLEERYAAEDYKDTEFRAYDLLRHETDPIITKLLDQRLSAKIAAKNFDKIHLAPPEFVDFDDISFCYQKSDIEPVPLFDDLRIADLVGVPRRRLKDLTASTIKNWDIFVHNHEHDAAYPRWNAYQCLVAEIEFENRIYILANGQWREVSEELQEKVETYFRVNDFSVVANYLPDNIRIHSAVHNQDREEIYNDRVGADDTRAYLFDKSKITIAGKRLYEICDILHADKHLVHVKRYSSGAASISHIFTQAKIYAHAFAADEDTRASMISWINGDGALQNVGKNTAPFLSVIPLASNDVREPDFTVIFCILHSEHGFGIGDLPFMSRYELMLSHRFLTQDRKFKVGVAFRQVVLGPEPAHA